MSTPKITNTDLINAGIFRTSWLEPGVVFDEECVNIPGGWTVVLNEETAASEAIYRIAAAIELPVPYMDMAKAITKHIICLVPKLKESFVSFPSETAVDCLVAELGGTITSKGYDLNTMEYVIDMTPDEEKLHGLLLATLDGNCPAARLVHQFGQSGRRTWFNDHFLPTIPFILHEKGKPVRLVGYEPHPKLHKQDEQGRFVGIEVSKCGTRCLLEFVVSEEAVEGNSFNVPVGAKTAVAGDYIEQASGIPLAFSLARKNARKFSGMGRVIRKLYPEYVAGNTAFLFLDKTAGEAVVELCEVNDFDTRQRFRNMVSDSLEESKSSNEHVVICLVR